MGTETLRLRGKEIAEEELRIIREVLASPPKAKRTPIAREICARLGWKQTNGQPQQTAALEILRSLEKRGLLRLPRAQSGRRQWTLQPRESSVELPFPADEAPLPSMDMKSVTLTLVEGRRETKTFAELMRRHHYLRSPGGVGRSVKYLFWNGSTIIGGISWGSASWKVACRDEWIGWDATTRIKNLKRMACNLRFLILPKVKNLARTLYLQKSKTNQNFLIYSLAQLTKLKVLMISFFMKELNQKMLASFYLMPPRLE